MSETQENRESQIGIGSDDFSRYLMDRIKILEERNNVLKEQANKIELERRFTENQKLKYERELRQLKSELERLKTPPMIVGNVVDVLENGKVIIRSSTGPQFVVGASQLINSSEIVPGMRVSLNYQTLAVTGILPSSRDPFVNGMEVIESPDVSYSDIGGLDEQIREVRETVEMPLTRPEIFERIGIEPPKGVLMYGAPGTGKTLLAKAVASQTKATFIRIVGSELVQKYIGEGARLVRDLFKMAKEKAPSIIFIDEIDSIGAKRLDTATSGDREVQRTLMQLLSEMDGFNARGNVRIIAATNRPDILDPALLRPGRFDRFIPIPMPDTEARAIIFKIHSRKMKLSDDVDIDKLASLTEGSNGSDLRAIVMEAGMFAVREERYSIGMDDFLSAIKKLKAPAEKQNPLPEGMFV
ncbi:26S proteasome subunit P45 family [Candidatus Methanoperedens nitroreducens]|uniref:Proteasome-activating nucleotidase n=1 Tax=Candidatus Methanoperedens nitratireducens TaxID=1392998 RepID=A0A062V9M9_9EURY|nr:proteasome-activating nucleotidase [Candidatus Methanoperedens nitroreducens]KCZ72060.1 26S proteasome subunit P45 family [Candidatus Methanoperedens nitroreducens]MDJ1421965.1 proteasome-activating nucleotidase [Candidatus Methanoperedens sp.]